MNWYSSFMHQCLSKAIKKSNKYTLNILINWSAHSKCGYGWVIFLVKMQYGYFIWTLNAVLIVMLWFKITHVNINTIFHMIFSEFFSIARGRHVLDFCTRHIIWVILYVLIFLYVFKLQTLCYARDHLPIWSIKMRK